VSLFLSSVSAFSPAGSIRHPVKFIIGSFFSFVFVSEYGDGLRVDHGKIGSWNERSKFGVSFCSMLGFLIFVCEDWGNGNLGCLGMFSSVLLCLQV